jgi:DNA polymerase III sliding clamp (beta) subunit (PCNA family)
MKTRTQNAEPITEATFVIQPATLKALAAILDSIGHVTSRDETRAALNSVFVEVDTEQWTFTGSDSYMLATATTPRALHTAGAGIEMVGSFMISTNAVKDWAKTLKARGLSYAEIQVTETNVTLHTPENTHTHRRLTQTFPNFRNLIPEPHTFTEDEKAQSVNFNPSFLAQLATSAAKLNQKEPTPITIEATHPTKPTLMSATVQDVARWVGILMPVRITR